MKFLVALLFFATAFSFRPISCATLVGSDLKEAKDLSRSLVFDKEELPGGDYSYGIIGAGQLSMEDEIHHSLYAYIIDYFYVEYPHCYFLYPLTHQEALDRPPPRS